MTDDVNVAVGPADFEAAMVGRQPLIEHGGHLDAAVAEHDSARGLFAAVTGVAFDAIDRKGWLIGRRASAR